MSSVNAHAGRALRPQRPFYSMATSLFGVAKGLRPGDHPVRSDPFDRPPCILDKANRRFWALLFRL